MEVCKEITHGGLQTCYPPEVSLYSTQSTQLDKTGMTRKKIQIAIREGKPTSCIVCGGKLHNKSEYYCSLKCESEYRPSISTGKPSFLSKWKVRKNKELKDPLVVIRKKVRRKTNNLIK